MMGRIIDRFDKCMLTKGLNDNKVTIQVGFSIGLLSKARKNGRDLSRKSITKILDFYTDINEIWLYTGKGNMLNNCNIDSVEKTNTEKILKKEAITEIDRLITIIEKLTHQNEKLIETVYILSKRTS